MRILSGFFWLFGFLHLLILNAYAAPVPEDTLRILGIRVEFQEDNSTTTTGNGKFDLSQPIHVNQIDPPPHNRSYFQDHLVFLGNYFLKVSRHRLYLEGDIYPVSENDAYQLAQPMTHYNPNRTPDENNAGLCRLFRDALIIADQDPAIDFTRYQSVVIFHAGVGKDVDLGYDETPQDIPSLFITSQFLDQYLGTPGIPLENGTITISQGIISPETESQDGIELGLNGILTSNFGSQLGWLDLFSPVTRRSGIGRFGLMDAGLFNGDGLLPALPCAWTRIHAGWEEAADIYYSSGDEFTIHATLSDAPDKIYRIPISRQEYFLVENRYAGPLNFDSLRFVLSQGRTDYPTTKEVLLTYYPDQTTFSPRGVLIDVQNPDIGLSGSGCLIWHIDERVIEQNRVANRINADPEHRGVDLEEADGSQDIGQYYDFLSPGYGSEIGWVLDMWYEGNNSPVFTNQFSATSNPNSRSYDNRANSHIRIYDFSVPDSVMKFRVSLDIFQQNFPISLSIPSYGKVKWLKTSDLDFDNRGDIICSTDQGTVLAVTASGYSPWGSDSFRVVQLEPDLIHPLLLFTGELSAGTRYTGMVAATGGGKIYGFAFRSPFTIDTLFQPLQISSAITTHPVGLYQPDSSMRIYCGADNGYIYTVDIRDGLMGFDSVAVSNEPLEFLYLDGDHQPVSITNSGKVYRNNELIREIDLPYFPPVGHRPVALTREGNFLRLDSGEENFAEQGLFQFDSPMIVNPYYPGTDETPQYVVSGNNRLYCFNYNFTLADNFPVRLYDPDRPVYLPVSPLINRFTDGGLREVAGMVSADPAGVIDGFDFTGRRLADFPLSAGDSILISPVILDMDGDGDLELVTVTGENVLYAWDLASTYDPLGWNQIYYDGVNSNRVINQASQPGGPPIPSPSSQLLPEKMVYNWPNPNIENFTFIRYFLTDQAGVNIKIYDLAGDLVEEIAGTGNPGTANEIRWDLTNIQSGVYLARIEASNARVSEIRFIKIAVIK